MALDLVDRTSEQLRILSILHYAAAGVTALFGCFPIFHVAVGAFLTFMPESMRSGGRNPFPREIGFFFMGIGLTIMLAAWSLAVAHFLTARFIKSRRHYWFCVVVSGLTCVACMLNTGVAGITSLVILFQGGVRDTFDTKGALTVPEEP